VGSGGWDTLAAMPTSARRTWKVVVRLLERDERLFAFLLAVVMVGGLATLGLALRPRHRIDLPALVFWFAMYKVGILALVSVNPSEQKTRAVFSGALAVDMMLIFALLYLTGGGDSLFVNLFYPLLAVNAYYFGRWVGLILTMLAGLLYWAAALLAPPEAAWTAVAILMGLVGLPAFAVGHVAERARRARAEVERLNAELTGSLTRLQAAQADLLVAERMATVGRLSLKVAHEVRNPIAAIELNAELVNDLVTERGGADMEEAATLVAAIREQVNALDAITEEYLAFARFPRPQYDEDSVNEMVAALVEFVRPVAARQGSAVEAHREHTPRGRSRRDRHPRHRTRHHARRGAASLRAVLHHQGPGHGARSLHFPADHRGAARRHPALGEHARERHHLHGDPAHQEDRG